MRIAAQALATDCTVVTDNGRVVRIVGRQVVSWSTKAAGQRLTIIATRNTRENPISSAECGWCIRAAAALTRSKSISPKPIPAQRLNHRPTSLAVGEYGAG